MTTVLECVKELGLAHSPLILTVIGNYVKDHFSYANYGKIAQEENGETIFVNSYRDENKESIKPLIIVFITKKQLDRKLFPLLEKTGKYEIYRDRSRKLILRRKFTLFLTS